MSDSKALAHTCFPFARNCLILSSLRTLPKHGGYTLYPSNGVDEARQSAPGIENADWGKRKGLQPLKDKKVGLKGEKQLGFGA